MGTYDVPGKKKSNRDELHIGCWAEHDDGSLLLIEGLEDGKVVYSIFDLSKEPPIEYRDAMSERAFKDFFSWEKDDDEKWFWHDKTAFPWDKIMAYFKEGPKDVSALDQMTAAERVAKRMELKGLAIKKSSVSHKSPSTEKKRNIIINKVQRALEELRA